MRKHVVQVCLALGLVMAAGESGLAGPLNHTPRDLMLGFRQTGATLNVEANIGHASLYYNAAPGTSFPITTFTTAQLATAFGSPLGNVMWSVSGGVNTVGDVNYPKNTMWVTAPRADVAVQTPPWNRASGSSQANTVSGILSIAGQAVAYSSSIAPGDNNTSTAVLVPDGSPQSYNSFIGAGGDLDSFQGPIENTTSPNFDTGEISRSDLYEIKPDAAGGPGRYLGYFDLFPDGTMTFTAAGGSTLTPPGISIANTTVQVATNGVSNAVFTVTLSASSTSPVTVNYTTQDGTAVAGTDYTTTSGTLNFLAGQTSLTVSVPALGRPTFKNSVSFTLALSNPSNGTLTTSQATGTIVDAFLPLLSVQRITRTGGAAVITFPTFNGLNYTLRYTNLAGLRSPISSWPVAAETINGSGLTLTLTNSTTESNRVYVVQTSRIP